jgi:hypothetical protein
MQEFAPQTQDSVLFVTLDSCRYDTFEGAQAPNLKRVGTLQMAQAPSYYTYGSHSAMFVGFTPGLATSDKPLLNPKAGKIFKLVGAGFPGKGEDAYELEGRNIVEGFRRRSFITIGTGAVGWFNPDVPTGRHLTESFEDFFYPGNPFSLARQIAWIQERLEKKRDNVFVFLNIGETHVPYYFEGAPWSVDDNPCIPFQTIDRSADCRNRQQKCCEFADRLLGPLLDAFQQSTIVVCGDHGDCWGEDGLWEHGISHPATLTVPLLLRIRGRPLRWDAPAQPKGMWNSLRGFLRR